MPFFIGLFAFFVVAITLLFAASFLALIAQATPLLVVLALALYWRMSLCSKGLH